jgi:hypothetical protein
MNGRDLILTCFIKYLAESMKFWPFNHNKREISYDDKNNQNFKKDWFIKKGFKNLKIKLLSIPVYFSLTIKLS